MDVFDYRTNRSVNTEGVFTLLKTDTEIGGLFLRLKNLMVSELHLDWDIVFLEQYSKERMVPRGLRWNVYPQQGDSDLESWFRYFNDTGISLLNFLIDKKRTRMITIDKEIKEIREKLTSHRSTPEYISHSTSLRNHLEKEEKDQKIKKQKKYTRDVSDYKNGSVFTWQNKQEETVVPERSACEMDISEPQTLHSQPSSHPPEKRKITTYNHHQIPPSTPRPSNRGPPPQGRGRGGRGRGRGQRGQPSNHDHYRSTPRGEYQHDRHHDQYEHYYPPRTPIHTYNRYSPLENVRPRDDYNSYHTYREMDPGYHNRSPFNYNQRQPGTSNGRDFPNAQERHKRAIDANVGPEGGGAPEKKQRI